MKNYFTKHFTTLFLLLVFYSQSVRSQQPEFYFYLKDNPGAYYTIYAEKFGTSPIYDENLNTTTLYNSQWVETFEGLPVHFWVLPNEYNILEKVGFDWVWDNNKGERGRGILGNGLYRIDIRREWEPSYIYSFYLDVRQVWSSGSPDLVFWFDYDDGNVLLRVNVSGGPYTLVPQFGTVRLWEILGITQNWSGFVLNSALNNDFNGSLNSNVPIVLQEAEKGIQAEKN